ncbi:MAG: hypothetical protein IT530_12195 [Burkholderiales bacterium]|nr:hypothetical protein [Burkholderiales bacterium]
MNNRRAYEGGIFRFMTGAFLAACLLPASAADFPFEPIRLTIPFGPGGPSDFVARTFGERLRVSLGSPVIVDSRPGGNKAIGTGITAKATPDGHTLLVVTMTTAVSLPHLQKNLPYSLSDLVLVNRFMQTPLVVAVHPAVPARALRELVGTIYELSAYGPNEALDPALSA